MCTVNRAGLRPLDLSCGDHISFCPHMLGRSEIDWALADAVAQGSVEKLQRAIDGGADPRIYSDWPLRHAVTKVRPVHLGIVKVLLQHGADPCCIEDMLAEAVILGHDALLQLLLSVVPASRLPLHMHRMLINPVLVAERHDDYALMLTVLTRLRPTSMLDSLCVESKDSTLRAFETAVRTCFSKGERAEVRKRIAFCKRGMDTVRREALETACLMDQNMSRLKLEWMASVARAARAGKKQEHPPRDLNPQPHA